MIVQHETSSPVISNVTEAAESFLVEATAEAFRVLSTFYADPLLAIPRELGANAWDSHVAAGNTGKKFQVHVPNEIEPWFYCRDYGTGMSDDDIRNIYRRFFRSTKTKDNKSDGCMGLGSKTPFTYTENFSVTSWKDGIKNVYSCFIDENRIPRLIRLASETSDEPSGLMVRFDVKKDDISMFVDKCRQAFSTFRHKPEVVGVDDINYPDVVYKYKGTGWGIRSVERYGTECMAVMGNYMYPIRNTVWSTYTACKNVTKEDLQKASSLLSNTKIDLEFNIGDLDVAPNKETLQFNSNDRTRAAIIVAAARAYDELKAQVEAEISSPARLWDALALHAKMNSHGSNGVYFRNIFGEVSIPYKTIKIGASTISPSSLDTMIRAEDPTKLPPVSVIGSSNPGDYFELNLLRYNRGQNRLKVSTHSRYNAAGEKTPIFFYTDSDGVKSSRIKYYLNQKYPTSLDEVEMYFIVDQSPNFIRINAHMQTLGLDSSQFINVESLPKPPTQKKSAAPVQKIVDGIYGTEVLSLTRNTEPSTYFLTRQTTVESTGTYYYVPMNYSNAYMKDDKSPIDESDLGWLLRYAVTAGVVPSTETFIYGINQKNRPTLKVGKWINVFDEAAKHFRKSDRKKVNQRFANKKLRSDIESIIGKYSTLIRYSRADLMEMIKLINDESARDVLNKINELNKIWNADITCKDHVIVEHFGSDTDKTADSDVGLTIEAVTDCFKTKFSGLFDLIDTYNVDLKMVGVIINKISVKS